MRIRWTGTGQWQSQQLRWVAAGSPDAQQHAHTQRLASSGSVVCSDKEHRPLLAARAHGAAALGMLAAIALAAKAYAVTGASLTAGCASACLSQHATSPWRSEGNCCAKQSAAMFKLWRQRCARHGYKHLASGTSPPRCVTARCARPRYTSDTEHRCAALGCVCT